MPMVTRADLAEDYEGEALEFWEAYHMDDPAPRAFDEMDDKDVEAMRNAELAEAYFEEACEVEVRYPHHPLPSEVVRVLEACERDGGVDLTPMQVRRALVWLAGFMSLEQVAEERYGDVAMRRRSSYADDHLAGIMESAAAMGVAIRDLSEAKQVVVVVVCDDLGYNSRGVQARRRDGDLRERGSRERFQPDDDDFEV